MLLTARRLGLAVAATCLFPVSFTQAQTLDLLVLHDSYSNNYFAEEPAVAMQNWVNQMNTMYANSQVDVQINLVGVLPHEQAGDDMEAVLRSLQKDEWVKTQRDAFGADMVAQLHETGSCGIAFLTIDPAFSYGVVGPACGPITMIHELGHTMGLAHSHRQGDQSGVRYRYGVGYGIDGIFATIMAYSSAYGAPKIGKFSNPDLDCTGFPCGVPLGGEEEANSTLALQRVREEVGNFRKPKQTNDNANGGGSNNNGDAAKPLRGTFLIKASHSKKCLTLKFADKQAGTDVVQWSCHKGKIQRWIAQPIGQNKVQLRNAYSKLCLVVHSKSTVSEGFQRACDRKPEASWYLDKQKDGSYRIRSVAHNTALMVRGSSEKNGALLRQWEWTGIASQKFQLEALN